MAREEAFNTISYALSQVSVHPLHLLCLSHVNRSLFGTDHYNDFEVNLMNQKKPNREKTVTKIQGKECLFPGIHLFFHVISCKCKNQAKSKNGSQMPS